MTRSIFNPTACALIAGTLSLFALSACEVAHEGVVESQHAEAPTLEEIRAIEQDFTAEEVDEFEEDLGEAFEAACVDDSVDACEDILSDEPLTVDDFAATPHVLEGCFWRCRYSGGKAYYCQYCDGKLISCKALTWSQYQKYC